MRQLQARDPSGRSVFFVQCRRRDLPKMCAGIAQPPTNFGGDSQVSAPFPALELRGCLARESQPGYPDGSGESHAGLLHLPARTRIEYTWLYEEHQRLEVIRLPQFKTKIQAHRITMGFKILQMRIWNHFHFKG